MTSSRWQSEESYEPIRSMDRIQLAWEFLRRNPDYRRDYRN
ncbi:transcriptional regulator domain-containing protein, partial [Streptomyces caniscabiei]